MNFVKFLLTQYFFDILFFNVLWIVARTPINFLKHHDEVVQMDRNKLF